MKHKIFHKVQEMYLLYINCDFFLNKCGKNKSTYVLWAAGIC